MKIILIGPSGVGKSTIAQHIASDYKISHKDIDEIFDRKTVTWDVFETELEKMFLNKNDLLIDIGAGYYYYSELLDYLISKQQLIIYICGDLTEIFNRQPVSNRSLDEFINTDNRNLKLYKIATNKIDISSLNTEKVYKTVDVLIKQLNLNIS